MVSDDMGERLPSYYWSVNRNKEGTTVVAGRDEREALGLSAED